MEEKEHFITHFMSIVLKPKIDKAIQEKKTKNQYPISFMNMDLIRLANKISASQIPNYIRTMPHHDQAELI